ncbi:MAG: hypothetical protein A2Z21_01140 [Candidatus Fraserbacteria bacterium RBG_16_55_9]|uniref:TPM domain-containing protein n=1 Tax=Fraserbacteria sp. (strain RBG_16_55_9) TaxID=1817864 RepID=A0A1F5UQ86_FRAXR|nr:MAG: hypothetical protein A2Z21_01140 [Candidatus Fraserbacteria bacterium RBG_16_55_9]
MKRMIWKAFVVVGLLMGVLGLWSSLAQAQSAVEDWAKQQISEKTGIDPNLLATLFVTDGSDQLILAFVYITQEVLDSNLKADLKQAIAPFVEQKAMLTLVVPTRHSQFSPMDISFSQGGLVYLITQSQIYPVTDDFQAGELEANAVSSGVIMLPEGIDMSRPFEITYRAQTTTFSLSGSGSPGPSLPSGLLGFFLQFLFLFFLFPFLIGI